MARDNPYIYRRKFLTRDYESNKLLNLNTGMMNQQKGSWLLVAVSSMLLAFSSCQDDWGKTDPPAGNQVFPKLEQVAVISFEDDAFDPASVAFNTTEGGTRPEITDDEKHGKVLHLNQGYATLANPLDGAKGVGSVSMTFWVKQALPTDGEEGTTTDGLLKGALFSFQNETGTQRLYLTANGWLCYDAIDGNYEANNPSQTLTGMLAPAGEWHYVALKVQKTGYTVYVDGNQRIDKTETTFDFRKIVSFLTHVPYIHVGYGSDTPATEMWVDDITFYKNEITEKQIAVPGGKDNGSQDDGRQYITIGAEDFSTPWWSAFSDLVTLKGDGTMHFGFYNYTDEAENWRNWLVVLTNGKNRDEGGYAEYCVLRADAYGWGDGNYQGSNITHDFNFDDGSFKKGMNGAWVDLTIRRSGSRVDITAQVTYSTGGTHTYSYHQEGIDTESIGAFLTCEGAYLKIDPEEVYTGQSYAADEYRIGPKDCSAAFWTQFSKFTRLSGNTASPFGYTFYNYTNLSANWCNWLLVCTNGKDRDESGYAEYFVLRADAYGWGDANYDASKIQTTYDFETWLKQMNGAYIKLFITRDATTVRLTVRATDAKGTSLGDYTFSYDGVSSSDIGLFLTLEGASLDMRSEGFYPFMTK